MTMDVGIVGQPVIHSLSPPIHSAWIVAAGLDARYDRYGPEDADQFRALIDRGRQGDLRGLNVTAPFKELALSLADEVGATAAACGSANLLVFENGKIIADSTDGVGLMAALDEQAPDLVLVGQPVVVLGAGGAARAAVAALTGAGARVGILNRTPARAEALAAEVGGSVVGPDALAGAVLVVNALSVPPAVGMSALRPDAVLMDMTYRPLMTPFLTAGRERGLTVVDGLAMLIGQARPSFRALFGIDPPDVDVRAVALRVLESGS